MSATPATPTGAFTPDMLRELPTSFRLHRLEDQMQFHREMMERMMDGLRMVGETMKELHKAQQEHDRLHVELKRARSTGGAGRVSDGKKKK